MPLFEEFSQVTKEDWLAKISAELKTKSPEELDWAWNKADTISPFQSVTHADQEKAPLSLGRSQNHWAIGAYLPIVTAQEANRLALAQLMGGVNAPMFSWPGTNTDFALDNLLQEINLSYISLHFDLQDIEQSETFLVELSQYLAKTDQSSGSVCLGHLEPAWQQLTAFLETTPSDQHQWQLLAIDGRKHYQGEEQIPEELAAILLSAYTLIELGAEEGWTASQINQQLHFHLHIGTSYLRNIAKIRALKVLWANVLASYDLADAAIPSIVAHCGIIKEDGDKNTQMIRAATQTITAVVGGADRIYLSPADGDHTSAFSQRIARNVQHLLQLESHMDQIIDPVAGSYYFERLSQEMAERSWSIFRQRIGQS